MKRRLFRRGPIYRIIRDIESFAFGKSLPRHGVHQLGFMLYAAIGGRCRLTGRVKPRRRGSSREGQDLELADACAERRVPTSRYGVGVKRFEMLVDQHQADASVRETNSIRPASKCGRDTARAGGSRLPKNHRMNGSLDERAKLSAGLRYLILKRDGFRCQLCGAWATESNYVRLEVDHKIPVTAWGRTEEANLWTLCVQCNKGKSNRHCKALPRKPSTPDMTTFNIADGASTPYSSLSVSCDTRGVLDFIFRTMPD